MTVPGPYGQTRETLSPAGTALVGTLMSAAIGAGTGALMQNQPSWSVGLVSGAASGVAGVVTEAITNPEFYGLRDGYNPYTGQYYNTGNNNSGTNNLYRKLPNGQFVAVQQNY